MFSFKHLALAINIFSHIRHLVPDYMDIFRVRDHLCLLASVKLISHPYLIPPVNTSIISKGPWTLQPSVCSIWVCFLLYVLYLVFCLRVKNSCVCVCVCVCVKFFLQKVSRVLSFSSRHGIYNNHGFCWALLDETCYSIILILYVIGS